MRKVEVGFDGGQAVSARLSPDALAELRKALETDQEVIDVSTEDGTVTILLDRVVFLNVRDAEHRVGF